MKQKCKDYADERKNARDSDIQTRDRVLLQPQKHDKLTIRYEAVPYSVVQRCTNQIIIESPGVQYKRNTSHVKKYVEPKEAVESNLDMGSTKTLMPNTPTRSSEGSKAGTQNIDTRVNISPDTPSVVGNTPRSTRQRVMPARLKDFVLN